MDYQALAKELLLKMQLLQKAKRQKSITDSTHGEAFALHYIKYKQGDVVPGDISGAMGISTARIATVLNSLESKGFITREIDLDDRRRIIVKMTPKGKEYEEKQERFFIDMITKMLSALGERDAREYVRITGRLAEAVSGTGCGPAFP